MEVLLIALALATLCKSPEIPDSCSEKPCNCEVRQEEHSEEFWPADMVPHPHPPGYPKDPKERELS